MAMAALESVVYPFLSYPKSPPLRLATRVVQFSSFACRLPLSSLSINHYTPGRKLCFKVCSTVQETATETKPAKTQRGNLKTKLFVDNLPFPATAEDIKNLFGQCGTVIDVEIIRQPDGRSKGFGFVTMASFAEAQAAVDKLNGHELSERIIRVQFAKQFKKPSSPSPKAAPLPSMETQHKLYVSNLGWKVRSTHLREFFFSGDFKPVSVRVVFAGPGKAAGYGFVSFATREEAEAAISALNEKELMGRPLILKLSEKKVKDSGGEKQEEDNLEGKPEKE